LHTVYYYHYSIITKKTLLQSIITTFITVPYHNFSNPLVILCNLDIVILCCLFNFAPLIIVLSLQLSIKLVIGVINTRGHTVNILLSIFLNNLMLRESSLNNLVSRESSLNNLVLGGPSINNLVSREFSLNSLLLIEPSLNNLIFKEVVSKELVPRDLVLRDLNNLVPR
jgi:hypothetical protein